jgi:hypothetical protein
MYGMKPIITQIVGQLHTEYENGVMKAVQSVGFDVDKERLAQALNDAQKFYTEGYNDAMTNHDVVKVVRCKDCKHWDKVYECNTDWHGYCHLEDADGTETSRWGEDFCSYGERRSE